LIWGAAGGIGRTIAREPSDEGWQVVAISRSVNELAGVADYPFE
jgi:NAD(P)-dependent dehydrogenase (short-subunit alcohol dehydrogenase family)